MIDELERILKETCGLIEVLRKTMKTASQDGRCPSRDWSGAPAE
jgi:hypothetical protein